MVEVLIAIALIAMVGTVLVVSLNDLLEGRKTRSSYEVLREAVDRAWFASTEGRGQMFLYYEEEERCFVVKNENGEPEAVFSFEDELVRKVTFERTPDTGGGTLRVTETEPFSFVVFSPRGGVTPATVALEMANEIYRYRLEPFSAALEVVP